MTEKRKPRAVVEDRIDVAASPEVLWSCFTDTDKWPQWFPALLEIEWIDGIPWTMGARFRQVVQFGFPLGRVRAIATISEISASPYVAWEGKVAGIEAIHGFRFDATPSGTEVLSRHEFYGSLALLAHGEWLVGGAVFVCSVVLPLAKLMGILAVAWFPQRIGDGPARARLLRIIEWVGRWGTLDVLLVALLVATLKLGDLVEVSPGPGLSAFAFTVALSLIASGLFDPHAHWNEYELHEDHER